jgi:hypothetical protein
MKYGGNIGSMSGGMSAQAGGKSYPLHAGQVFEPRTDEIGRLPADFVRQLNFADFGPGSHQAVIPAQPPSSPLSPCERGLDKARIGNY